MTLIESRAVQKTNDHAILSVWWLLLVLIIPSVGGVRAATNDVSVILSEDFERYTDTASMSVVWKDGSSELVTEAPGGGKAALNDGSARNGCARFSVLPGDGQEMVFSADLYDYATNIDKRVTVALRNETGDYVEFGHLNKLGPYSVRLVGFNATSNWFSFDPVLQPTPGWHRYQAIISPTNIVLNLDLGADGSIDKTLKFEGATPKSPFTNIRFGGLTGRKSKGGPVLIDNIKLALVSNSELRPASPPADSATSATTNAAVSTAMNKPMTAAAEIATDPKLGANTPLWWIVGALAVIITLLGALLIVLSRNKRATSLAVATIPSGIPDVVRDRVPKELTEFAKQSLVQGLYTHRNTLIEVQKRAHQEIIELEARLAALELPLHERIRAYENRIAELEKELESRGEEMRELTQATLLLVREKLEKEKKIEGDSSRSRFN